MAGIEFLEPPPRPAPDPPVGPDARAAPPASRYRPRYARPELAAAGLWAAAAGLSLLAAFSDVYTVRYGSGPAEFRYTLDGWGRYTGAGAVQASQYGARWGIVLSVVAVAGVALAGLGVADVVGATGRRTGWLRGAATPGVVTAVGTAVCGLLAGVVLGIYLQTRSVLDGVEATVRIGASAGDPIRADIATSFGSSAGVGAAALGCAVLAVLSPHVVAGAGRREPEADPPAGPGPPAALAD